MFVPRCIVLLMVMIKQISDRLMPVLVREKRVLPQVYRCSLWRPRCATWASHMLISYNTTKGIAIIIWEKTSAGVSMAEIITMPKILYFLAFRNIVAERTPKRAKK